MHARKLPRRTLAVVQNDAILELADASAHIGVPAGAYLHALGFEGEPDQPEGPPFAGYVVNSQFTAGRCRRRFGLQSTAVPLLFRRGAAAGNGSLVRLVNRVAVKHVYLALQIAGISPHIPFIFVLGWPLGLRTKARLEREVGFRPIVVLRGRTTDMRTIYRDTRGARS